MLKLKYNLRTDIIIISAHQCYFVKLSFTSYFILSTTISFMLPKVVCLFIASVFNIHVYDHIHSKSYYNRVIQFLESRINYKSQGLGRYTYVILIFLYLA